MIKKRIIALTAVLIFTFSFLVGFLFGFFISQTNVASADETVTFPSESEEPTLPKSANSIFDRVFTFKYRNDCGHATHRLSGYCRYVYIGNDKQFKLEVDVLGQSISLIGKNTTTLPSRINSVSGGIDFYIPLSMINKETFNTMYINDKSGTATFFYDEILDAEMKNVLNPSERVLEYNNTFKIGTIGTDEVTNETFPDTSTWEEKTTFYGTNVCGRYYRFYYNRSYTGTNGTTYSSQSLHLGKNANVLIKIKSDYNFYLMAYEKESRRNAGRDLVIKHGEKNGEQYVDIYFQSWYDDFFAFEDNFLFCEEKNDVDAYLRSYRVYEIVEPENSGTETPGDGTGTPNEPPTNEPPTNEPPTDQTPGKTVTGVSIISLAILAGVGLGVIEIVKNKK